MVSITAVHDSSELKIQETSLHNNFQSAANENIACGVQNIDQRDGGRNSSTQ